MGFFSSLNPLHALDSVVHATESVVVDAAQDFAKVFKDVAKTAENVVTSEIEHTLLDAVEMVPGVGTAVQLAMAGVYAAEGDWKDAATSAIGAVPGAGEVADAVKLGEQFL